MVPPPPPIGAVGEVAAGPERVPGLALVNALSLEPIHLDPAHQDSMEPDSRSATWTPRHLSPAHQG